MKKFFKEYLWALIPVTLGTFMIYAIQNPKPRFDIFEFFIWLPYSFALFFALAFAMLLFLNLNMTKKK